MNAAVHDADNYLFWACDNQGCEFVNRESLVKLYRQFAEVTRLRRPVGPVEEMTDECLLEEVALAALSVKYDAHAKFILEQLTPGREEFEALGVRSPVCAMAYARYHNGQSTWADAVEFAHRELTRLIALSAGELGVPELELPDVSKVLGLRDKVQYCVVLCDLLQGYQRLLVERATTHMIIPPDMTAEDEK